MKLKTLLLRKGIFSRLDNGMNAHSAEDVLLWRRVLDEMLIGMIGTNTSAKEHSMRWFNSNPGDIDYYFDEISGEEIKVDAHKEFCEACMLADLDPNTVRVVANRAYQHIIKEEELNE